MEHQEDGHAEDDEQIDRDVEVRHDEEYGKHEEAKADTTITRGLLDEMAQDPLIMCKS